ncbi:MAG: barstar [Clostridiales bacterium]|nr:barstar [Clostridiales bacterium]
MNEIRLDLTQFEDKISLHSYIKETLSFPFYYGANLDALHDELTSNTSELSLTVVTPAQPKGAMEGYLPRVKRVFQDAATENYHLTVRFEEA